MCEFVFFSEWSWCQSAVQSVVLQMEALLFILFYYFKIDCKKMLFCIKRSFVWLKKIVFDESFYEIVLLLMQFFSCTWLLLFLQAGRLCNILSDLRFFLFIWWFFFNDLMKYNHGFFSPLFFVRFSVSCFFKKRKVFSCWFVKKVFVEWIGLLVEWVVGEFVFFLIPIFFWMGLNKFFSMKEVFFKCVLFSFIIITDEKNK